MRRVVITGLGVVSPLGITPDAVADALRHGRSAVRREETYAEMGFRSQVAAIPPVKVEEHVDKRQLRFMGPGSAYAYIAMQQAIADAGLTEAEVSSERTGLIAGSGGPSTSAMLLAHESVKKSGATKRIGPFAVPKCMSSTVSANLATSYRIKGLNYSITSACSTSLHCIGNAMEQILWGKQDIMFAGGGEEVDWTLSCLFDAMGAMSSKYNDTPETASRPFDATRDGFVISGGGGILVLEELEHAKARGARIYAEITGYGATSDGADMVAPSGEGGARSMRMALATIGNRKVGYINAHGTSTPAGDVTEVEAVRSVFGEGNVPPISSSKSLAGHSQGATGVLEAIYTLLMMERRFLQGSANITTLDPAIRPGEILTETVNDIDIDTALSNSFGFGGTNATMIFSKYHG